MKDKTRITRLGFVTDEAFNYFIQILVTTTFLGYILSAVGIDEALQGIINTLTTICMSAQLLSPLLAGRRVKRIVTVGMLVAHLSFAAIYLIPISALPKGWTPVVLVLLLVIGNAVNNAVQPSRLLWFISFVDKNKLGRFTAVKEIISLLGGIVISLGFGVVADAYRMENGNPKPEYYIICFVALLLMTAVNTVALIASDEKDPLVSHSGKTGPGFLSVLKNSAVLKIIGLDLLWYFAYTFSVSFYPSYLREDLGFSFTVMTLISTVSLAARIFVSPIMGKLADKYSFKTSLAVAFLFQAIAFLGAVFAFPGNMKWFYLIYAVFSGFAMAGVNSGLLNIVCSYVPYEQQATAIGLKAAVGGAVGLAVSLLSGAMFAFIQKNGGVQMLGVCFSAQQIQSAISFAIIVVMLIYMRTVMKNIEQAK